MNVETKPFSTALALVRSTTTPLRHVEYPLTAKWINPEECLKVRADHEAFDRARFERLVRRRARLLLDGRMEWNEARLPARLLPDEGDREYRRRLSVGAIGDPFEFPEFVTASWSSV